MIEEDPHSECVIRTPRYLGMGNLRLIWKFCLCSPGRQIVNNVRRPLSVYTLVQRELQGDDLRVRSQTSPFHNFSGPATLECHRMMLASECQTLTTQRQTEDYAD